MKLLKEKNFYEVMNLPKESKEIKNFWKLNIKSDGCYKSWLVAKTFSQVKEIDFDKLFFPVICHVSLFLAIAILEDWDIHSINVKTIYLYSDLDKKIYIEQPEGFRLSSKEKKV